jgi:tetratricopeptide repeat protein
MSEDRRAVLEASTTDRDRRRRGRRAGRRHPPNVIALVRPPVVDRVGRETTLVGALQLVDEGLAAAEDSYRRVLALFEASLGEEHREVADVHRRLSESENARGNTAAAEHHARRALEIDRALGALPLHQKLESAVGALS